MFAIVTQRAGVLAELGEAGVRYFILTEAEWKL